MNTHPIAAILPFLLVLSTFSSGFGQNPEPVQQPPTDTTAFFLYVDYYGIRYNKSIQQSETIITAVKLPIHLLKKMPRLKGNELYSARNRKTYLKQQEILKQANGEKLVLRVNKKKVQTFYPGGLKRGTIIDGREYNRWNFREQPVPVLPPVRKNGNYDIEWYWYRTDPVNITYGLPVTS